MLLGIFNNRNNQCFFYASFSHIRCGVNRPLCIVCLSICVVCMWASLHPLWRVSNLALFVLSETSQSSTNTYSDDHTPHDSATNKSDIVHDQTGQNNFSSALFLAYRACARKCPKLDTVTPNTFCPLISFPQPDIPFRENTGL